MNIGIRFVLKLALLKGPRFGVGPFFLALWCWLAVPAWGAFLDPVYERLDESELRARFDAVAKHPGAVTGSELQAAYFFHERLSFDLKIHEAERVAVWLQDRCHEKSFARADAKGQEVAAGFFVCALVEAQQIESSVAWEKSERMGRALACYRRGAEIKTDSPADRYYAEGRLYLILPELPGMSVAKGLLAFQFLHRLHPEKTSPLYFLSQGYRRTLNHASYELWWSKALSQRDPRAVWEDSLPRRLQRAKSDGLGHGLSPQLFYSPNGGFGLRGTYLDDRWGDVDRKFSLGGFATSRGQWGGSADFEDYVWLAPTGIRGSVQVFQGEQDNFDLGPHSLLSSLFVPEVRRQEGRVGFVQFFEAAFSLELGWIWFHQTANFDLNPGRMTSLPAGAATYFSGPFFELAFDTRDSEVWPRTGGYVKVFGNFPTNGLMSPRTFEKWKGQAGIFFPGLFRRHVVSVQGIVTQVSGSEAPWAQFPRAGSPLKALREGRFVDRALVGNTAEYALPLGLGFGAQVFLNALSVDRNLGNALGGAYQFGGGGGISWSSEVERGSSWQFNVSQFGGETVWVGSGGLSF